MKVYACIKEMMVTSPVVVIIQPGDRFYEKVDTFGTSYVAQRGYPYPKDFIEKNTVHFERLPDDDHEPSYYLDKVYTQYEVDQLLNKNNQ